MELPMLSSELVHSWSIVLIVASSQMCNDGHKSQCYKGYTRKLTQKLG